MKDSIAAALFALLGIFALLALSATWNGFALSVLWDWFIVPVFHAPALRVPYAIGLGMVVSYLTHQQSKNDEDFSAAVVRALLKPVFALLIGWIVLRFV